MELQSLDRAGKTLRWAPVRVRYGRAGEDVFLAGPAERLIDETCGRRCLALQAFQLANDPVST